jgi:hypothetical protein
MKSSFSMLVVLVLAAVSCSSSGEAPAGACKTGGSATGSYEASCNQCARENCDKELKEKAGSGWSMQVFGGDGACAAFNACLCQCLGNGGNVFACVVSPDCLMKMDAACSAAVQAAQTCLNQRCSSVCR